MNIFIISGKGFLKPIKFDIETKCFVIEWTQNLREADKYKSGKKATELIKKFDLDAFVWNPYKEEPIRGKWEIIQRKDDYNDNHKILEWIPERVVMMNNTDVKYLMSKGVDVKTYYDTYEDAVFACKIKNIKILEELQEKINNMDKTINIK